MNAEILHQDIQNLLELFAKNYYKANDNSTNTNDIMQKCLVLMKIDYNVVEISNNLGELSSRYPSSILIPEYEHQHINNPINNSNTNRQETIYESIYDANKLRDLINKARIARCRGRFPMPVILYRGKYICRSATLSGGAEMFTRSGIDYFLGENSTVKPPLDDDAYEAQESSLNQDDTTYSEERNWLYDRVRSQDIKLLRALNVETIVDLMVEKKKVKYMVNVTSSEKVDKEKRYQDFNLVSLPYPGCEFFEKFRSNNYSGGGLLFDWSQKANDAELCVPEDSVSSQINIDWEKYRTWDLVQITQNYMKLLLKYIQDNSSGLLIHCISGWDRTPLFVSLLRLSLWADGVIHQSLNPMQILYFTIAYDWFLFGHNLPDRIQKGEEIFFFCFYALKYLMEDEYSIAAQRFRSSKQSSSGSSSIGVIRTDSDVFDGMLFDGDSRGSSISLNSTCSARSQQDQNLATSSNGAHDDNNANGWVQGSDGNNSFTLFSSVESVTNMLNVSPQLQRRTSPMSVPKISGANTENKNHRQRQESTSSVSVGSWQMISGTGSLRSQDSNIVVINEYNHHPLMNPNNNNTSINNASSQTNMCSTTQQNSSGSTPTINGLSNEPSTIVDDDCFTANDYFERRERLNSVRTLFYNCYSSTIGYKFKNGPDSALGSLLGNFAEKVGLTTQRTPI
ncbi:phosphatidylinositol-3,5-bisphosphate 3-phosphatase MTMR14 isoform X2 [Chironomus tepperi]|uniref:phosphatidylinositol-3,5-bisphosphate 3-phosphatase MTMR14 isoform X2 n=1 Tax=Chironomus tepperi TaxID=113505 RepID=UPI00391F3F48